MTSWTGPEYGRVLEQCIRDDCYGGMPQGQQGQMSCVFADRHEGGTDNKASMSFNFNEGLFHCFTCGAGGNLHGYLVQKREMTSQEACAWMEEAGLPMDGKRATSTTTPPPKKEHKVVERVPEGEMKHVYKSASGEIINIGIKRPAFNKEIPILHYYPVANGWACGKREEWTHKNSSPLYGLDRIANAKKDARIIIVEGEKDVDNILAAQRKPGFLPADVCIPTTWMNGAQSWKKADWSPIAGRPIALISDDDEPGRAAMKGIAQHLHSKQGCTNIKLILQPGNSKKDISDLLAEMAPQEVVARIKELSVDYKPSKAKERQDSPPRADDDALEDPADKRKREYTPEEVLERIVTFVSDNPYFTVDGKSPRTKEMSILKKRKKGSHYTDMPVEGVTENKLMALAPHTAWGAASGISARINAEVKQAAVSALEIVASDRGFITTKERRGLGCSMDESRVVYHLGQKLLIEGKECEHLHGFESDPLHHRYDIEEELPWKPPSDDWREKGKAIVNCIFRYAWENEAHAATIAGFLGSALASGAFRWRLNIMLLASSNVGKSWLINNIITEILAPHMNASFDASAAATALHAGKSSLPFFVDEMNPDKVKENMFDGLKASSSDTRMKRSRVDTSTNQGLYELSARTSYFYSLAKLPQMSEEIENRLRFVRLSADKRMDGEQWKDFAKDVHQTLKDGGAEDIRNGLVAEAHNTARLVRRYAMELMGEQGNADRTVHQDAVIAAGLTTIAGWPLEQTMEILREHGDYRQGLTIDSVSILERLLTFTMQGDVNDGNTQRRTTLSVLRWLEEDMDRHRDKVVEPWGIKYTRPRGNNGPYELVIGYNHPKQKELAWKLGERDMKLTYSIGNIDGVVTDSRRRVTFDGKRMGVLIITPTVLERLGYTMAADGKVSLDEPPTYPDVPVRVQ